MRSLRPIVLAIVAAFFASPGPVLSRPTHVAGSVALEASPAPSALPGTKLQPKPDAAKAPGPPEADASPLPTIERFARGADVAEGLFTIVRKAGKVYISVEKAQLDREYYEHATTANGLGGYGILSGDDFQQPARIVKFERVSDRAIALVLPQYRFNAEAGTAIASAVEMSSAASIVAVLPVVAQDKASGKSLVDVAFMLGDTLDLANGLSDIVENPKNPKGGYHQDPLRTYFGASKAFPKNVVIEADQTFASFKPDTINTVTDPHSILMRVKYNLAEVLGTPGYVPRIADDRVGFWQDPHVDFTRDDTIDNIERLALRWDLRASDPTKPSPAVRPIVYTLTNTIPDRYRGAIREGVLEWNKAFKRIGILDAVRVADQPNDPSFDPDDIRYNTIRWLTEANGGGFLEAQIEWDPRTGEIFRGGVLIDSDFMRYGKFEYADVDGTELAQRPSELWNPSDFASFTPKRHRAHGFIHRDTGARAQATFGVLALTLLGEEVPTSFSHDYLKSAVEHEIGHDFGLAHNFIGHNAYTMAQLRSKAFTSVNGVASSVMEYAPFNIWPKNSPHGDYNQTVLGPYDYHAIHWGYAPIAGAVTPQDEVPTLDRWAQASIDPKFAFASDEDNEYDGHAVDPRIATYMLSNDSIGWCESQLDIDRQLIRTIDTRYPRPGMPWDQERTAFGMLIRQYGRCGMAMTHYIAGEHLSRARRGDPHAPPPLTPISRDEEYRAFRNLDTYFFNDSAWDVSSSTLRRLTYSEYEAFVDFGNTQMPRHDLSLSALVATYQNAALGYMYSPLVLQRLADLPSKAATYKPMTMADLFTWTQSSVYGDLVSGTPATTSIHRNLQRNYARMLERMATAPPTGTPYDAQALARHELVALAHGVHRSLGKPNLDLITRAHLEALGDEVSRTLDPRTAQSQS